MTISIQGLVIALAFSLPPSSGAVAQTFAQRTYDQFAQAEPSSPSDAASVARPSVTAQIEAQRDQPPTVGGVDSRDPTANVIALQRAATQRQDDLREASERFILAQIAAEAKLNNERVANAGALRAAESQRLDDLIALRADYQQQLAKAEANRIDAIRTVDVNAVGVQNQRAVEQAAVLSTNVTQSAETLRNLVANTATTVAAAQEASNQALSTKIDQAFTGLQARVAALEQAQYVGQGRQTISDPALQQLTDEVRALAIKQSVNTGESSGSATVIAYIFGGIGAAAGLAGLGALLFNRRPHPSEVPHPVVRRRAPVRA